MAELMRDHTTMRVGGPVDMYLDPKDEEGLIAGIRIASRSDLPLLILGNGSNVIIRDGGFAGVVLSTTSALTGIDIKETTVIAGAGETLSAVAMTAAKSGLSGLEEVAGIPGTVGGAVFMNAGAYDKEISDILTEVRVYDSVDKKIIMLTNEECKFGYRTSIFKETESRYLILDARFSLKEDKPKLIKARIDDYKKQRNLKQPLDKPSAGSFFKRPEGYYAGKLIEEAGLKGHTVGGAQISTKHAGFIVNTGNATASDVLLLAAHVQAKVRDKSGVELEFEPIILGEA